MSEEVVLQAIKDEQLKPERLTVGGKDVLVRPLKRRWQLLFRKALYEWAQPQMQALDQIKNAVQNLTIDVVDPISIVFKAQMDQDASLDEPVAVILASQVIGAEKRVNEAIAEQKEWLLDNSNNKEMRALVDAQEKVERMIDEVGESLPARFTQYLHLTGAVPGITEDTVKRLLTNSSQKLPATLGGAGESPVPKPGGSSSDTLSVTELKKSPIEDAVTVI
jgi:hypothetical protein